MEETHLSETGRGFAVNNFSHTEHVLQSLIGGIPLTPSGSGVRAALTNNKLERWGWRGGGGNSNISVFLSSEHSFWTGK